MSLTVELALARCAAALGGNIAYLSEHGIGSPLLSGLVRVERMALRPLSGLRLAPFARYARPVHLSVDQTDAARILLGAAVIIDGEAATVAALCRMLGRFRTEAAHVVRTRGPLADTVPGMSIVLEDRNSGDAIWIREDLLTSDIPALIAAQPHDEFDAFSDIVMATGAAAGISRIQFTSDGGQAFLSPPTTLDMPDAGQLDAALGAQRAVFDTKGSCALVIPFLSFAQVAFGFTVSGLAEAAPDPAILSLPDSWQIRTRRERSKWHAIVTPDRVTEAAAAELVLPSAFSGGDVEVSHIWTGIRRRHDEREAWHEAEAQLDLEQSW